MAHFGSSKDIVNLPTSTADALFWASMIWMLVVLCFIIYVIWKGRRSQEEKEIKKRWDKHRRKKLQKIGRRNEKPLP